MKPEPSSSAANAAAHEAAPASDRTPLDWPRHIGRLDLIREAIAVRKKRQRRRRLQAAVAGATAMMFAGVLWLGSGEGAPWRREVPVANRVIVYSPEQRTLPDGSVVELRAGSNIAVDFAGEFRRVALTSGEAHFQVAKDPARPFVVTAGGMEFRAVGTAFAVQVARANVEMIVTHGTVAVERSTSTPTRAAEASDAKTAREPLAIVDAGYEVIVERKDSAESALPRLTPVTPSRSAEKLAWRVPRLELNETPLAEAIEAINRYSRVPIVIGDGELGRMEISGTLRADNIEPLLQMLESNYGVGADQQDAGKIVLRRK